MSTRRSARPFRTPGTPEKIPTPWGSPANLKMWRLYSRRMPASMPASTYFRNNCIRLLSSLVLAAAIALGGCASEREISVSMPCGGPCSACPVCPTPETAEPTIAQQPAPTTPVTEASRGRLELGEGSKLPDFAADDPADAFAPFVQGCTALPVKPEWRDGCSDSPVPAQ